MKREAGAPSIPKRFDAHVAPSAPIGSPALSSETITELRGNASPRMPLNASSGSSVTSLAAAKDDEEAAELHSKIGHTERLVL
jgi:hypothetical protein